MALTITNPTPWQKFQAGDAIQVDGRASPDVVRVDVSITLGTRTRDFGSIPVEDGAWSLRGVVRVAGRLNLKARGRSASGAASGLAELPLTVVSPFVEEVPLPANLNPGLTMVTQGAMLSLFGGPPGDLTKDCSPPTNARLLANLVTESVGPLHVTGLRPAITSLRAVLSRAAQTYPQLVAQLGTAGMLCCRRVKLPPGSQPSPNFSNHSWGTAIDLKIAGLLDDRGDQMAQRGLVLLAPIFNDAGWFWGAAFKGAKEDSMHFEASAELISEWKAGLT